MAKHHLIIENEFDYDLVGICSPSSDYRIAWEINQAFGLHLSKNEVSYAHFTKKGAPVSLHSMYEFNDEDTGVHYFLVKNKKFNTLLIPEKAQIDYFVFLKNNYLISIDDWIEKIRECPSVATAFAYFPEDIKSCENLLI